MNPEQLENIVKLITGNGKPDIVSLLPFFLTLLTNNKKTESPATAEENKSDTQMASLDNYTVFA